MPDRSHIVKAEVRVGLQKILLSSRSELNTGLGCHGSLVTAV